MLAKNQLSTNLIICLQSEVDFLYKHFGITFVPESLADDDPRIIERIKKGNMLQAIAIYRQIHNVEIDGARAGIFEIKGLLGI